MPEPSESRGAVVGLGVALLIATWARSTAWPKVFVDGEILPQGGDSAYHLRRTLLVARDGGVQAHDPWMNWPAGGPCHWAPGLDAMVGWSVRLLGLDGEAAAAFAMFVPVILGVMVVAATWAVARMLTRGTSSAVFIPTAAAVLVALLPQAEATGRVGRLDHHVAEVLCMTGLGAWALGALRPRGPRWELFGAAVLTFGLVFFAGSVLYAAVAAVLLLGLGLLRGGPLVGSGAPAFVLAAVATAALYGAPPSGAFSYVFPSYLQPLLLLIAAAALAGVGPVHAGGRARRLMLAAAAGGVLLGMLALPTAWAEVQAGLVGWLARQDPWLASIREFQPLLANGPLDAEGWTRVRSMHALPGLAAVVTVPLGVVAVARRDRRAGWIFGAWTVLVVLLTLWQLRFGRLYVVNLAICTAEALWWLASRFGARRGPVAFAGLAALIALSPGLRKPLVVAESRSLAPVEELAVGMRAESIEAGRGDGVFAPWDMGHPILALAHRPVVATGFGTYLDVDGFAEVDAALRGSETAFVDWMDRRDLGWALAGAGTFLQRIVDGRGRGPLARGYDGLGRLDPEFLAEYPLGVLLVGGSALPGVAPHIEQLRPVAASTAEVAGTAMTVPVLWTYRRVDPMVLRGDGVPGEPVVAAVELHVGDRVVPWFATGRVASSGSFDLRVPFDVGADYGGVRVGERFQVRVGDAAPFLLP